MPVIKSVLSGRTREVGWGGNQHKTNQKPETKLVLWWCSHLRLHPLFYGRKMVTSENRGWLLKAAEECVRFTGL